MKNEDYSLHLKDSSNSLNSKKNVIYELSSFKNQDFNGYKIVDGSFMNNDVVTFKKIEKCNH